MRNLFRWITVLVIVIAASASIFFIGTSDMSPSTVYAAKGGKAGGNTTETNSCGGETNVVVAKLVDGVSDTDINVKYGTATYRRFPGTNIYVFIVPSNTTADQITGRINKDNDVVWAEAGQFGISTDQPSDIVSFQTTDSSQASEASLDQFAQAALDQFTAAALDQFTQAALDQFMAAALDQFTQATLDQFSAAALDQFSTAALDQFSTAILDQFATAILDQFTLAILDQFGQAALDQFSTAILDQFSTAALDQFSTAILDQFSTAALDQFNQAILDQFSTAALDQFSTAIMDQFTQAVLDQFTQAALDQFSTAALDQFSAAIMDQFSTAILDQFTQAMLDQFSTAALDQFATAILDQFTQAMLDQFSAAIMDQFTQAALDQFSTAILDQFTQSVLDQFSQATLDQFIQAALDQFTQATLDQFSQAALDQFIQSILDQFDGNYFQQLLLDVLDTVYGSRAREQVALANINVTSAQQYSTGAGVLVAVIDTGISDHWFLRGRIADGGFDFVDGDSDPTDFANGIDDNGNGLVDEGWSHGTHVAGIVSLVAPDAMILPIRVQDSDGGGWSFLLAEAIQYAVDQGAHVINASLEVPCESRVLEWAANYASDRGVVLVASAGNSGVSGVGFPARFSSTVAVAALDDIKGKAGFSNYGADVTVSSPGVNIYSAYANGLFAWWSGTSQASPMIAGQAALLVSASPWLDVSEVSAAIKETAANIDAENSDYVGKLGGGQADLMATLWSASTTHEFTVNTVTPGVQEVADQRSKSIAMNADGDFVVTWSSHGQDGDRWGVYAQRYNSGGVPQGPEFQVNTITERDQYRPSVAMDSTGNFVIAWGGIGNSSSTEIFARRYDSTGAPQGGEFVANTNLLGIRDRPSIAMDADGDFVITWSASIQDPDASKGIYAQRYDAAGFPQGGEFRINTTTVGDQLAPVVAMDATGGFVVAWEGTKDDPDSTAGIYAQRYDAAGVPLGGEFRVNTTIAKTQKTPSIAVTPNGDFVVAWQGNFVDSGSSYGIFAQRYDATGAAQGSEFMVNTHILHNQQTPSVAVDADGDFVITWQSMGQDHGKTWGIFGQRYDATGTALGSEFLVNTTVFWHQEYSSVAMDSNGNFTVIWSGNGLGDSDGVFGQRYSWQ